MLLVSFIIIHFIYRWLQLLVKNILIQIDKEIHSYHKNKIKKKKKTKYLIFAINVLQILCWQDMLCICLILDLKRYSDLEFLISKGMSCQIWGPLKTLIYNIKCCQFSGQCFIHSASQVLHFWMFFNLYIPTVCKAVSLYSSILDPHQTVYVGYYPQTNPQTNIRKTFTKIFVLISSTWTIGMSREMTFETL